MILYIDTTPDNLIELGLKDGQTLIAKKKFSCRRAQAEMLLPAIEAMLKAKKIKLKQIKKIEVANRGGSFTSLRIGVVTANALACALGIPAAGIGEKDVRRLKVVKPYYDRELEITAKKRFG